MQTDESLDPQDWEAFRAVAHRMVDDMIDHFSDIRKKPVWQPQPPQTRARFDQPVPVEASSLDSVYAAFLSDILPYPTGNLHPCFWGWVMGTGTPVAMLAEMLAAGMNCHVAGYDQAAAAVENQVVGWFRDIFGFPADASGLLLSGGSAANLSGLTVARNQQAGYDVRQTGLSSSPGLRIYASREIHSWAARSCELLGLGRDSLHLVAVDADYRIDMEALEKAIVSDIAAGWQPICVIGSAGTVNTGAIDPLDLLADLCQRHGLWFHVDGAFGALAVLVPSLRDRLKGIERADSLAFDLHKWGYLPYEVACILVRNPQAHLATYQGSAAYLRGMGRGIQPGSLHFADLGIQLSRGFRGLKVWMSLQTQGLDAWSRLIEQNVRHVQGLVALIEADPRLELLAPAPLNVACFRYASPGLSQEELNALNREILLRIQESGHFVVSATTLNGSFALRVAHTNHRTRFRDLEKFLEMVMSTGAVVANSKFTPI